MKNRNLCYLSCLLVPYSVLQAFSVVSLKMLDLFPALDGLVCIPRMIRRQESYPVGFRQLPKSFLQAIVKNALHLEKKVYDTFWNLTYGK